jgi:membrane AbrB-like protein
MITSGRASSSWILLVILTLVIFAGCGFLRLPAAPLLAGIAAGSFLSLRDSEIRLSRHLFSLAQGLLGLMISLSFSLEVMDGMRGKWFLAVVVVAGVVVFGLIGGVLFTVRQWLPGTTGIWGISPGGATPMVLMSEAYGGDMRLVAIMQYLRVIVVSFIAVSVARFLGAEIPPGTEPPWLETLFPPIAYVNFALTLGVAVLCCALAQLSRVPAASLLLPMFAGAVLQNTGLLEIELPNWLLTAVFMLIGWNIGLRFNRSVFLYAFKAMPKILGAIFSMVAGAGILAAVLVAGWDIDPLTAYLATSPGGADTIAIIAASSGGDMVFIMATQTLRLFVVLLTGPYLARAAAHFVRKRLPPGG